MVKLFHSYFSRAEYTIKLMVKYELAGIQKRPEHIFVGLLFCGDGAIVLTSSKLAKWVRALIAPHPLLLTLCQCA